MPGFKGHHASKPTTTATGSRLKQGDQSLPRLKSTMFASMNKSEPNLANPACSRSLSTAPAHDMPQISAPPKSIRPNQQLSLSSGKASHSEVPELPRSLHSGYHPSIRSIFNQTSKRISEFTSRLNGPSVSSQSSLLARLPPPDPLPPTPRSPVLSSGSQGKDIQPQPEALPRVSLAPLQRTPHHQEDLPLISQTLLAGDNPPLLNKIKRSNARVHSPNFYQSLKSRWKPDSLPAQDLFNTISSATPTSRSPPKTYSNFEKMKADFLGDFQTPEISQVSNFAESSLSTLAAEIVKGTSEENDVARSTTSDGANSDCTGQLSSRTAQADPASGLRAFSISSHNAEFGCLPQLEPTDKPLATALQPEKAAPLPSLEGTHPAASLSTLEHTAIDQVIPTKDTAHPILSNNGNPSPEGNVLEAHVPKIPLLQPLPPNKGVSTSQSAFPEAPKKPPSKLPSTATQPALSEAVCDVTPLRTPVMLSANKSSPELLNDSSILNLVEPATSIVDVNSGSSSNGLQCSTVAPSPLSTIDQIKSPATEVSKSEPMTIAEGLHHKHHLNFAARRSSISMVLKRPDSLDASTPVIFQGIWEKELEENERKWKRLARLSGSQSSSRYSTESYTENHMASQTHGERAPFLNGGNLRHSSSITSQHLIRLGRKLSQNKSACHTKSQSQSDVLDQVWDSFKCEAELSLSDISCDRSIIDDSSSSPDCEGDRLALHQITFNNPFQRTHSVQDSQDLAHKDAKPIGLGLFHPCDPPIEGSFSIQDEYSPITNAKLKKLSLLAMRDSPGAPPVLRGRRRRPANIIPTETTDTNQLEINPASLDLSLLDAFPVPPRSHRSSQSSSSSHSLKAVKATDLKSQREGAATPTAPTIDGKNVRPSPPHKDVHSHQRQKSSTEASKKTQISFTLTSFSNRPRAQTSVRSPVPPPLNLRASPSPNLNQRRRTMTSHISNHSHSGPEAIPPVPFLHVPNTAPLVSTTNMSHDRDRAAAAAVLSPAITRPSFPTETKYSKAGAGGMTPKRPSLLIRPSLRSPHRAGIRPFRSGEASPSPKVPPPFSPSVPSPTARGFVHTIQQSANSLSHSIEQAGYFSSPHASVGSSTGTASSSSTVPSPATPTSLRMTYNSRIPSVPMCHSSNNFSSGVKSPIKSTHPDNPRYVMIDQTPKYSGGARGAPETIKASRVYRPELLNSSPLSEPNEQVSYGMAL